MIEENIELELKLIRGTTGYKEHSINAMINKFEGKQLLIELIEYWNNLNLIMHEKFNQDWKEKMIRDYNYPRDHWD